MKKHIRYIYAHNGFNSHFAGYCVKTRILRTHKDSLDQLTVISLYSFDQPVLYLIFLI